MQDVIGQEDVEHLVQEVARPLAERRTVSTTEFARAITAGENRRRAPRVNLVASDVLVQVNDETVSGVDFSLRGLQFRSATRLAPGTTILLNIRWCDERPSTALARVMWATFEKTTKLVDPHYRVGVILEASDFRAVRAILERCGLGQMPDVKVIRSIW